MRNSSSRITSYRALILAGSVLASSMAAGQAMAQDAEENTGGLADIIVTAQKREQSLQDVPISVTALAQDSIQTNRVTSLVGLASVAPGVTVRNTAGSSAVPQIIIRGALSTGGTPGQDKAVSINIDGVYMGSPYGITFDIPEIERIEVLRGPQGTLFGRNSTGGAINFITRDPSGEFGLRQEVSVGNYDQLRTITRVELPQVGPFSAYVSYMHDERRGDIRNLGAGTVWDYSNAIHVRRKLVSPTWLGSKNNETVRVALKFAPSENFTNVYKFDQTSGTSTTNGTGLVAFTPEIVGNAFLRQLYNANPTPIAGLRRPKAVNNAFTVPTYLKASGHSLTSTLVLSDQISLKNILAYRKTHLFGASDTIGLGGPFFNPDPNRGPVGAPLYTIGSNTEAFSKQWTEEIQLNYDSDFLTLTTGAVYYHQKASSGQPDGLRGSANLSYTYIPGLLLPAGRNLTFVKQRSVGGYAQAEVHITPTLNVIGGFRVTGDKKPGTAYINLTGNQVVLPFDYKKTKLTYEIGANYKPIDEIMVYGKYATGYISGGSVAGVSFNPEEVKSWELGFKSDLFDRRVRFNLAGFFAKYTSVQQPVPGNLAGRPDLQLILIDQGDSEVKGFESELTVVPVDGLTLNGSLSYFDYKWTRLFPAFGNPATFPQWLRPSWTSNVGASYESQPLFGEARFTARLDANWSSKLVTPGFFAPLPGQELIFKTGNNWLVNGRVAIKDIGFSGDSKAEIAVWSRNLLNSKRPIWGGTQYSSAGTSYEPARTIGVDLILEY